MQDIQNMVSEVARIEYRFGRDIGLGDLYTNIFVLRD